MAECRALVCGNPRRADAVSRIGSLFPIRAHPAPEGSRSWAAEAATAATTAIPSAIPSTKDTFTTAPGAPAAATAAAATLARTA
jgi:hypothetical protein